MAHRENAKGGMVSYERTIDHSDRCPSPQSLNITEDEKEQIIQAVNDSGISVEDLISTGLDCMLSILIEKHSSSRSPFTLKQILDFEILVCDQYDGDNNLLEKPIQLPYVANLSSDEESVDHSVELSIQSRSNLAKIWKLTQISHGVIIRTAALLTTKQINSTLETNS